MKKFAKIVLIITSIVTMAIALSGCQDPEVEIIIKDGSFKSDYFVGEHLYLADAILTVYIDSVPHAVAITANMVTGFNTSSVGSGKVMTVTYDDGDIYRTAKVIYNVIPKEPNDKSMDGKTRHDMIAF